MKECFKCYTKKPLSDFYEHPRMADGYLNKCKQCTREDVRSHRVVSDSVREYDRCRGNRQGISYTRKYRKENPEKYFAHTSVNNAVRDGRIVKPMHCEDCKEAKKLHGHHDDYSKPLEVRWLCSRCHSLFHAIHGKF